MAYCSYCAAVLDPAQTSCSRCGRPVAAPPPPVSTAAETMPASVRLAGILLLISVGVSVLTLIANLLTRGGAIARLGFLIPTVGLWVVWIVLVILLWQRQGWARIAVLLFIAWNIGNLIITVLRLSRFGRSAGVESIGVEWTFLVAIAMDGLRLFAAYLTFRPESNAWFKTSKPG